MRLLLAAMPVILLVSVACDKAERERQLALAVAGDATTPTTLGSATTAPATNADAAPAASLNMPERPIPRPQTTVGSGMPTDVQMKAIAYMVAMRSPRPDDPAADPNYAKQL